MDLAIRDGTVVVVGSRFQGDIGVSDGKVVQMGGDVPSADIELDASGKFVIPGGVDMHVHLSPAFMPAGVGPTGVDVDDADEEPGEEVIAWADDFASGSRAAAVGGITTIGNITFPRVGETPLGAVERTAADAARESIVDFVLHPVLLSSQGAVEEVKRLAEFGCPSIKIFMLFGSFDSEVRAYVDAMDAAGANDLVTMLHCEDACVVGLLAEKMIADGRGHTSFYGKARPVYSEAVAVARAAAFAEATGATVYIVHLSSRDALEIAHKARSRGVSIFVETRPIYLFFNEADLERPDGALYIGNPPLRTTEDVNALWGGMVTGLVHTCCTDHAPAVRAEKLDPNRDITTAAPGMADLETLMPLLYSKGVRENRLSLERFVDLTATSAARIFGIYPQKGTIAVGGDADIVVWDADATRTFSAASGQSRSDFSLYEDWPITGWPAYTISRGEIICEGGRIVAPAGRGTMIRRATLAAPAGRV